MNQLCKVCGEPAAGFHFGAFTCEGCKSFFGRMYNNFSQIHECRNGGNCVINKQNRTSCKACRFKKCRFAGMSKNGSRYGRRSNWFKIHCLLQEQALQLNKGIEGGGEQNSAIGSPAPMTSLSPDKNEEDARTEISTESVSSDSAVDAERKSLPQSSDSSESSFLNRDLRLNGDSLVGGDFVANFGLYTLHPSLSLLHASQFYSRFYPPSLYPGARTPQILIPPPYPSSRSPTNDFLRPNSSHSPPVLTSSPNSLKPSRSQSPFSTSPEASPNHSLPSPPLSLVSISSTPLSPFIPRKRGAESPLDDPSWKESTSSDQAAPIDLSVKRRRLSTHSTAASSVKETPPHSPPLAALDEPSPFNATITAPIDLTCTKA